MSDKSSADDIIRFETQCTCPDIPGKVILRESGYTHATTNHPETAWTAPSDLLRVASDPYLVAESHPGKNNMYAGNLVLSRQDIVLGSAWLHLYLTPEGDDYNIASFWYNIGYHGPVRWRAPGTGGS